MKVYHQNEAWPSKVNFVDQNNLFVGYDTEQLCCEHADWYISSEPFGYKGDVPQSPVPDGLDLEPYAFDPEWFMDLGADGSSSWCDEGGAAAFRLIAPNAQHVYLTIFNAHNGYYSHGFEFGEGKQEGEYRVIREGSL